MLSVSATTRSRRFRRRCRGHGFPDEGEDSGPGHLDVTPGSHLPTSLVAGASHPGWIGGHPEGGARHGVGVKMGNDDPGVVLDEAGGTATSVEADDGHA